MNPTAPAGTDTATRHHRGHALVPEDIQQGNARCPEQARDYVLSLGDDSLILAQRLGWWISRAPEMEEDIALGNIALDLIGHARFFLSYAGTARGETEDDLAYFRDEEEFLSCRLVEQDNGDFAHTIARQLFFSCYAHGLYTRLSQSSDTTVAAIARKATKEVDYHVDHCSQWLLRLGLGTDKSHTKMQKALDYLWPYLGEMFEDLPMHDKAGDIAVAPSSLKEQFLERTAAIITAAGLTVPTVPFARSGQRTGRYSEHRGYILAEMQVLARQYPGATW